MTRFFGVSVLLFAASAAITIALSASMSAVGGMLMPGDWTMSMMWMRMPGQTWPGTAASFIGMWTVMMVAMMLPSLVPMLLCHRRAAGGTRESHLDRRMTILCGGYFFVWGAFGMVAFALGMSLAAIAMRQPMISRAAPIAASVVVLTAGVVQFSPWKARHLKCCRDEATRARCLPDGAGSAWRHGVRLGLYCGQGCANLMVILLVIGIMDLRAMAVVTAAITAERLAPGGARAARAIGGVVIAAGLLMMARAAGLA